MTPADRHIINLALNDGAMKGKIKIYKISPIPKQHLEAAGGCTSGYLWVKTDNKGQPSCFFMVVQVMNSDITQLGDRIKNCQINNHFPKIWGDHMLVNIMNGLRIPQRRCSSLSTLVALISAPVVHPLNQLDMMTFLSDVQSHVSDFSITV